MTAASFIEIEHDMQASNSSECGAVQAMDKALEDSMVYALVLPYSTLLWGKSKRVRQIWGTNSTTCVSANVPIHSRFKPQAACLTAYSIIKTNLSALIDI